MDDFHRHLNECLKDPAFKKEWDLLAPEREHIKAMIRARNESSPPLYETPNNPKYQ
jgi:hypothetical protein